MSKTATLHQRLLWKLKQLSLSQWLSILSGISLSFCLYVYQAYDIPSGYSDSGHSLLFRVLMFGLLTSFSFFINEWLFYRFINKKRFVPLLRVWELVIGSILTLLLYNVFWKWANWTILGYLKMLLEYTGILIFPILGIHFYERFLNREKIEEETSLNDALVFNSKNGKHSLSMNTNDFLYAKSEDNYVRIVYLKNEQIQNELFRNTLSNVATSISNQKIHRCHRSYIVNISNVHQVHRKNGKVTLQISIVNTTIPVSNKYKDSFIHP